jgi:hypothetical protein
MASRYFLNIGTDWGSTANWSDTSGGAGGFSVPTNADDVFFDANSGNCNLNANRVCGSINFSGYTGTVNFSSFNLTNFGDYTLSPSMTFIATTGTFIQSSLNITTKTLTNNGYIFTINFQFSSSINPSITYTLVDDLETSIGTTFTLTSITWHTIINGGNIKIGGNFNTSTSSATVIGTSQIKLIGTGNVFSTSTNIFGAPTLDIEIDTTGTITFVGNVRLAGCNFIYTSGTVITTGSTINIQKNNLNSGLKYIKTGINCVFDNLLIGVLNTTGDYELLDDLYISGQLTFSTGGGLNSKFDGYTIYCSGSFNTNTGANAVLIGTTNIIMNGTGTLTTTGTGAISNNIEINTTGLITFLNNIRFSQATFLVSTPDNVDVTNSTFFIASTTSNFQPNGLKFWNMNIWILNFIGDLIILNELTFGLSNGVSGIQGGNIYLYGNVIMNGGLAGTSTIENLYIVGNAPTSIIWTAAIPNILVIPNLVINTPTKLFLRSSNASGLLVLRCNLTHILGKVEMPVKTNRLILSPGGNSSFNGDVSVYRLRNIRVTQNITLTFNDSFFCGTADEPLDIRTATTYPYTENLDYALTYNITCNKPVVSHFTKIRNAVNNQSCIKMTYHKANLGYNRGILFMENQLPKGFSENKPITEKVQMFGKLTADPLIVR